MKRWMAWLLVAVAGCGGGGKGKGTVATKAPPTKVTASADVVARAAAPVDPGASLIAREREVWALEGSLVAEADKLLRSPEAAKALGPVDRVLAATRAEQRVRGWLRGARGAETRARTRAFLEGLDRPTRELLDRAAGRATPAAAAEDVFMDYLTYEGLLDLAIMRYGFARFQAGRYQGAALGLAKSFFAETRALPTAGQGIKVVASDDHSVEIDVFGARVRQAVSKSEVVFSAAVGRSGVVEWTSNYEQLRQAVRGVAVAPWYREALDFDGKRFRVSYAVELDEYLTWNSGNPWASVLYALPADQVADLYAGAAAAGGLEAVSAATGDAATLPSSGWIGTADRGLEVKVGEVALYDQLADVKPRRGHFAVVMVTVRSTLAADTRAPAEWFTLTGGGAEYPEVAVLRPGLRAVLLALTAKDARGLALPFTTLKAGATTTLALVYDVPRDKQTFALSIGSGELALKVVTP